MLTVKFCRPSRYLFLLETTLVWTVNGGNACMNSNILRNINSIIKWVTSKVHFANYGEVNTALKGFGDLQTTKKISEKLQIDAKDIILENFNESMNLLIIGTRCVYMGRQD